eukprot:9492937-Pyramimonas_sp.AAC.1
MRLIRSRPTRRRRRRRTMRRNKTNDVHKSLLGCPLEVVLGSSWGAWGSLGCLGDPLEAHWGSREPL